MSKSDESLMTIKEYADEQHISQQTVYYKIRKNPETLKNHVFRQKGKTLLDKTAQDYLKPASGNA